MLKRKQAGTAHHFAAEGALLEPGVPLEGRRRLLGPHDRALEGSVPDVLDVLDVPARRLLLLVRDLLLELLLVGQLGRVQGRQSLLAVARLLARQLLALLLALELHLADALLALEPRLPHVLDAQLALGLEGPPALLRRGLLRGLLLLPALALLLDALREEAVDSVESAGGSARTVIGRGARILWDFLIHDV